MVETLPKYTRSDGTEIVVADIMASARSALVSHKANVNALDLLADGVMTSGAGSATAGSLVAATTYYWAVAPANMSGTGKASAVGSGTPGTGKSAIRLTFPSVAGADYYDLFLSVDAAAPKHVARVTEAQRAAGGKVVVAETYAVDGTVPAGAIDVGVVGTGLACTNALWTTASGVKSFGVVDCKNKKKAYVYVTVSVADLRSAPSVKFMPVYRKQGSSDSFVGTEVTMTVPQFERMYTYDVDGCTGFGIALTSIAGQGAAISVDIELV